MNKLRGEVSIVLDGETYAMAPTFGALCEIESTLDISIPKLAEKFADTDIKIGDIAVIVHAGVLAADPLRCPSVLEIGNAIMDHPGGMTGFVTQESEGFPVLATFLINGVTGGREPKPSRAPADPPKKAATPRAATG